MKQSKTLVDEHTEFLYSQSVSIIFPQMQKSFPSVLTKRVYQVPLRICSKSSQRKTAKHKKTSHDRLSKRTSIALTKKLRWEAKKRGSDIRKGLQLIKVVTSPVINL